MGVRALVFEPSAMISSPLVFRTNNRLPAFAIAALSAVRGSPVHSVFPVAASTKKNCPRFCGDRPNKALPTIRLFDSR